MKTSSQSGFAIVEFVVLAVLVAAIIATGIFVWHEHNTSSSAPSVASTVNSYKSPTTSTLPAPQITSASDLNKAMLVLNQTSVSSNNVDSSQLSTYSSSF